MQRPNIIFILADDLGYGDLGCYGQEKIQTPCLDLLAEEGLRFTHHYAGAPVCGPSRACLMTGHHQGTGYIKGNPLNGNDIPLRPQDTIIPEVLKQADYETACIGKWGLGKQGSTGYPNNKGFDYFFGYDSHRACHNYYPEFLWRNEEKYSVPEGSYSHDLFTEEALKWIGVERDHPFFLYLAYTIPHSPYNPPDEGPYSQENWSEPFRNYAAMITRMDRDIGRIMKLLSDKRMDDNTLVVFSSDNGPGSSYTEESRELVRFFHSSGEFRGIKRDVYDGGIREPFIARWPGQIKPGISHHISAFQDVLPTFAELAGLPLMDGIDGISMVPTLLGHSEQMQHDLLYWEFVYMGENSGGRQSCLDLLGGWKGVRYGSKGALELYNANTDWVECHDIAQSHPEVVQRLQLYLDTVRTESEYWPMPEHGWHPEAGGNPSTQ